MPTSRQVRQPQQGARRSTADPRRDDRFARVLETALARRVGVMALPDLTAYRVLDGRGDDVPGLFADRYGPAVVLNVYEDSGLSDEDITNVSRALHARLADAGVESVYVKAFVRDRSRLGGRAPDEARVAMPRVGAPQPPAFDVREHGWRYEVRMYDGFSTGLFLDHRHHRRALAERRPSRALNLFSYTCAFAVPLVALGARVTNVDVSARYLEWGRRNLRLNDLDPSAAEFRRMGALEYLAYAARHPDERFDLVVLDPPTFAAGDRRRGIASWKAREDYPALLKAAVRVLTPGGAIFAATNTRDLAASGALPALVRETLGRSPRWLPVPPWPDDITDPGRVAAVLFAG